MNVSLQALNEFISLYKDEFGVELDTKTARMKAIGVLRLFQIVYKQSNINDLTMKGGEKNEYTNAGQGDRGSSRYSRRPL